MAIYEMTNLTTFSMLIITNVISLNMVLGSKIKLTA